ncbi:MAG: winged helix-turn-helix domain-containing protein [Halioglobus sp.]
MTSRSTNLRYHTGGIDIAPDKGTLAADSNTLHLGPINMKVLEALLRGHGELVSREELFKQVWPNQLVSDETLTKCISDIRLNLGKLSSEQKFIHTVPKKGYQWLPEVIEGEADSASRESRKRLSHISSSLFALVLLAVLLLVSGGFLLVPDNNTVTIALLPIRADGEQARQVASALDDNLQVQLVETNALRLLSGEAVIELPPNPFHYLHSEFGTHWVLEGRVRAVSDTVRVSLSLVDASTAIVIHTRIALVSPAPAELARFSEAFIAEIVTLAVAGE